MLLTDIRRDIAAQAGEVFGGEDIIPLPCNPDSIAIAYGLRDGTKVTPITQLIPKAELLAIAPNTISFEQYPALRDRLFDLFRWHLPAKRPRRGWAICSAACRRSRCRTTSATTRSSAS